MKSKSLAGAVIGTCLGLVLAGCSSSGIRNVTTDGVVSGITVSSHGEVKFVPDTGSFTVSVVEYAKTASEARSAQASRVKSVTAALKDSGIDDKHIQTSFSDVSLNWDYEYGDDDSAPSENERYVARTTLDVSEVDLSRVAEFMDTAIEAGADEVGSLTYGASEYDKCYEEALAKAIDAAHDKALVAAEAGNVKLGSLVNLTEGYQNRYYAADSADIMSKSNGVVDETASNIEPGEIIISADVTCTYDIR